MGELIDKTKGKIKEAVGKLTGNKKLQNAGKRDQIKGEVKGIIEDVKDAAKDVARKVEDAVE